MMNEISDIRILRLQPAESRSVAALVNRLAARHDSLRGLQVFQDLRLYSQELPERIRQELNHMRLWENPRALIVSGCEINKERIGATPHVRTGLAGKRTFPEEALLLLHTMLLGEPFGWSTQQDGRIVHDVLPVAGEENEQMGSSSASELLWHTEDAFHDLRCDYIGLICLRNEQRVETTVGWVRLNDLDSKEHEILYQPRFLIRPDSAHTPSQNPRNGGRAMGFAAIEEMNQRPRPVPVLFGNPSSPYLRIDPAYMEPVPGDWRAERALRNISALIGRNLQNVVLEAGDLLLIDNYQAVHGRKPFHASYDGKDRWLKRVNITRDLRYSRFARESATSLLISRLTAEK